MSEPKSNRNVLFNESTSLNVKLVEIGYNDFRQEMPMKLFRIRNEYIIHYNFCLAFNRKSYFLDFLNRFS